MSDDSQRLIENTDRGLYCPPGDFYIDAWSPKVARNIITHAHSDHARRGSQRYLTSNENVPLLKHRLGDDITVDGVNYGEVTTINGVNISLHPAGHVFGSSQIRLEHRGQICVASGDYKRDHDPTCRPFELVRCHTFITECTFGLPLFKWDEPRHIADQINGWWRSNVANGRTSILLAYSLGKAQRVLAGLDPSIGPILLHGAVSRMVDVYRQSGVDLPPAQYADVDAAKANRGKAIVIAPPSAMNSPWARKFSPHSLGVASGWMRLRGIRRRRAADRGFVLSDHVDFPQLLRTINETGADHIIATHGYTSVLARLMRERGKEASEFKTHFTGEEDAEPSTETAAEPQGELIP